MTYAVKHLHANTIGYSNDSEPEVGLFFSGPRGGNKGLRLMTPAEAHRVGLELIKAAKELDPNV